MAKFDIKNSNIGQLSDSGNNFQVGNPGTSGDSPSNQLEATGLPRGDGDSCKVFVVHGHDNEMKEAAARVISKMGLTPIILHEQANEGKTIIEKFEKHADVGFAVVLFSPDDLAYRKLEDPSTAKSRARQNVILELGYFVGKLNRSRIFCLCRDEKDLEMPSDIFGLVYTTYDEPGQWKFSLLRDLRAANYNVDANDLI